MPQPTIAGEIKRYLRTGDADIDAQAWPGDIFERGKRPFADFIVHEAAHIFHNCKRRTIGLHETRRKEWLLDIEFTKRETFAYSCEAYARIVARAKSPADRRALAVEYGSKRRISADRVDPAEVGNIVTEAATARNGWKVILARCAPTARPRSIAQLVRELNARPVASVRS